MYRAKLGPHGREVAVKTLKGKDKYLFNILYSLFKGYAMFAYYCLFPVFL